MNFFRYYLIKYLSFLKDIFIIKYFIIFFLFCSIYKGKGIIEKYYCLSN